MARRVIATAEVQVAADVKQAEVGLNGLTESFRNIGQIAARAAERTEAAFMSATGNIRGGYQNILRESNKLLVAMESTDAKAASMAGTFREALAAIKRLSTEDGYEEKAVQALGVYKQIVATLGAVEAGLHDSARAAEIVLRNTQEIEGEIRAAEIRAEMLGEAFRDVGQDIDLAMAGGLEGIQNDIRDTIRRLDDMGGQFRDVGIIGADALDGIQEEMNAVDAETGQVVGALLRLERQLRSVEEVGDNALEELNADARKVAESLRAAELGVESLGAAFRDVGQAIDLAMAGGIEGIQNDILETIRRLQEMGGQFRDVGIIGESALSSIREELNSSNADLGRVAGALLRLESQLRKVEDVGDGALEELNEDARKLAESLRAAEVRAEVLRRTFRDVGQAIEVAMAGGLEGVQDDIRDTIRRLEDMGGEFREVARIGASALDEIQSEMNSVDVSAEQVVGSLIRLERQLRDVEKVGDNALDELNADARAAAASLNAMAVAGDRADRSIDSIGGVTRRVSGDVRGLIGLLGAAGLGYAAGSAARFGLEMTQQLEKSEAAFLGLTGSVEGAANMLQRMVIFARETPYNLASVTEAAAQLLAVGDGFGVTAQNVDKYLTTFGNAITITGGSEDQFIRIVRVLGQMSSTGKVLGQDMNQLAQNLPGYDVWQALADGAGTSVQELRRLQDLGQLDELLTGNEAVEILIAGMEGIPGAAGAMERRMNTLGGAIEKFKETAQLATSQGLEPFSETAQDMLSDPVILRSVEDLAEAFGGLLSNALEDIGPELDDLAAAGENFLTALGDWTPVLAQIVDSLGDFLNFISPIVSGLGKATEAVLGFGGGIGKLAVAAGAFAAGGPIGIGAGVLLGVSGAMDLFAGSSETAANMARLLAAAQDEVNVAMARGEEVVYSEAQQLAIDSANELREEYGELFNTLSAYGLTINDLYSGMEVLATGVGTLTPEFRTLQEVINNPDIDTKATDQFNEILEAYKDGTDVITEEAEKQADALVVAGVEEIGIREQQLDALQAFQEQEVANWQYIAEAREQAAADAAAANDEWAELDEDRLDQVREVLEGQVEAYQQWESEINDSTSGVALSLSDLADDTDNSVDEMIARLNENAWAVAIWKEDIVTAAAALSEQWGISDQDAQNFMGTLGEMGPAAAPAIAELVADHEAGGTKLKEFYDAVTADSASMASSLTDAYDEATGSVPTLAEEIADGTATIDDILAQLPEAMEAAGLDMEDAAELIDLSDEMGTVGDQAVDGLVNALDSGRRRVAAAAERLAAAAPAKVLREWQISSPSRVFMDIGEFAVQGLVRGIQNMSDQAYVTAVQTAKLMSGGIAWHFRNAKDPQREARRFAEDVANAIVDELIAEQEAVADAAEKLARAAADRLADAWDRVRDRFTNRDIKQAIIEAQAELAEAQAELRSAQALAGSEGAASLAAAEARVADARAALAAAEAADDAADRLADQTLKSFQRGTEDAVDALRKQQEAEKEAIQGRIDAANRNLDPVARAAAEAELAAAEERHEAEMTALERRREDEEEALSLRLDNENAIREAAIQAKEDELRAFEDALEDVVDSIRDAIENMPELRQDVLDAQWNVRDAFFDQFEQMLENVNSVDRNLLKSIGSQAGLTTTEVNNLINAALASASATKAADAANLGVDQLINLLGTGLYTIGANGALGIAAGLNSGQRAIADAMYWSVQSAINKTLANLEIRSPSRVTERMIGEPMAEGIAKGILSAESAVSSAMAGLVDSVVYGTKVPSASQLAARTNNETSTVGGFSGPLVTMPNAVIQDATDADLVAQRVVVALAATGIG